jgi:hypothetical protein
LGQGPADFSGAWEAQIDASVFRMPAPRALRMWIDHRGGDITQRVLTVFADGTERLADVRYRIGQRLEAQIGGQAAVVSARWDGATLVIESEVGPADPPLRLRDHWSMSADGATLTMAHPDDILAGQVCVLRRVVDEVSPKPSSPPAP